MNEVTSSLQDRRSMLYKLLNVDTFLGTSLDTPLGPNPLPDPLPAGTDRVNDVVIKKYGNASIDLDVDLHPLPPPLNRKGVSEYKLGYLTKITQRLDLSTEVELAEAVAQEEIDNAAEQGNENDVHTVAAVCARDLTEMKNALLHMKSICVAAHDLNVNSHKRILQFQESLRRMPFLLHHMNAWTEDMNKFLKQPEFRGVDVLGSQESANISRLVDELEKYMQQWEVSTKVLFGRFDAIRSKMRTAMITIREEALSLLDNSDLLGAVSAESEYSARRLIELLGMLNTLL